MPRKTIKVQALARVEGEGGLYLRINNDTVQDARLEIFEPPRFFEAFLRGRDFMETPDIVARICGICPVAYQMSGVHALENTCGVKIDGPIRDLRRMLYCGEWIESNVLHVYMLHAPDFLGYPSAIELAKDHPGVVEKGLALKKAGNDLIEVIGGRAIHPINIKVGGFHKSPSKQKLRALLDDMKRARDIAVETVAWAAALDMPDYERDYEFVSLRHESEYPMNEGRIVSSAGMDIAVPDYERHFEEIHVPHSTALHSTIKGRGSYLVGPLARFNLNRDRLSPLAAEAARSAGYDRPCRNPFASIVVRSIEVVEACDEAIRLIENYSPPDAPAVEVEPKAATGFGATEAPRGLLYHSYRLAEDGTIEMARIIPPTSQNQPSIEQDLQEVAQRSLNMNEDALTHLCEQTIRNYDPCISCATHFLKLNIERT
ncbi:MAG: Ni/Fe hydrogenase subunit alpha [Pseudomonadota bacterium]